MAAAVGESCRHPPPGGWHIQTRRRWCCCCNTVAKQQETSHTDHWHHIIIEIWVSISLSLALSFLPLLFFLPNPADVTLFQTQRQLNRASTYCCVTQLPFLLYSVHPSPLNSLPHLAVLLYEHLHHFLSAFPISAVTAVFSVFSSSILKPLLCCSLRKQLPCRWPLQLLVLFLYGAPRLLVHLHSIHLSPSPLLSGLIQLQQTGAHFTRYLFPCFVILPSSSSHH